MSKQTIYVWTATYGGMHESEAEEVKHPIRTIFRVGRTDRVTLRIAAKVGVPADYPQQG